jgi:uroporphyrinogen decarboxylase
MTDELTSRQRVAMALAHQETDRVPADLGGVVTGIHRDAYNRLKEYWGIEEETVLHDFKQQLPRPCEEVLTRLGVDTRYVDSGGRGGAKVEVRETEDSYFYTDAWDIEWRMPKHMPMYFDMVSNPMADWTVADMEAFEPPPTADAEGLAHLETTARDLHENTQYAVVLFGSASFFEFPWYLRKFENFLLDMVLNENFVNALLDKLLQSHLEYWEAHLDVAAEYVDVLQVADDYGHQDGPMMSLELFDKYVYPRQREVISYIKSRTDAPIMLHSCGSIRQFIPRIIQNGIDAINPVQVSAANMDPAELKAEFGDRIAFWGGIDTQQVLPLGTPEQVAAETRRIIDILGAGGGYVLNSVHNIQADVPPENIIAMFQTARDYHG